MSAADDPTHAAVLIPIRRAGFEPALSSVMPRGARAVSVEVTSVIPAKAGIQSPARCIPTVISLFAEDLRSSYLEACRRGVSHSVSFVPQSSLILLQSSLTVSPAVTRSKAEMRQMLQNVTISGIFPLSTSKDRSGEAPRHPDSGPCSPC